MEQDFQRTKGAPVETEVDGAPKFRWRVVGEKPFHGLLAGKRRIYKPGEVFIATEVEIPMAFRDVIQKTDHKSVEELEKKIPGKVPTYSLQLAEEKGEDAVELYYVVNHNGKKINKEKPLPKEEARQMITDLIE